MLLVIPGGNWQRADIEQLRHWQQAGFTLAGHGWKHHCEHITGLKHQLHARLISRNCAEHLALDSDEIKALLLRNFQWFEKWQLQPPTSYVPPAWAMGAIARRQLNHLPFRFYEYQSGVYDALHSRFYRLPVVGFEADNSVRKAALTIWNAINCFLSSRRRVLRISIHPFDNELLLADAMEQLLLQVTATYSYDVIC